MQNCAALFRHCGERKRKNHVKVVFMLFYFKKKRKDRKSCKAWKTVGQDGWTWLDERPWGKLWHRVEFAPTWPKRCEMFRYFLRLGPVKLLTFSLRLVGSSVSQMCTDVDPDEGKVYLWLGVLLLRLVSTFMVWSQEEKVGLLGSPPSLRHRKEFALFPARSTENLITDKWQGSSLQTGPGLERPSPWNRSSPC